MRQGFYRLSRHTVDILECDSTGNGSACVEGFAVGACADGHEGVLCKTCTSNASKLGGTADDVVNGVADSNEVRTAWQWYDKNTGRCTPCKSGSQLGASLAALCTIVIAISTALWLYLVPSAAKRPLLRRYRRAIDRARELAVAVSLQAKLKIFISFYQVTVVLGNTYSVKLPDVYTEWIRAFDWLDDLDAVRLLSGVPRECIVSTYSSRLIFGCVTPLVAVAIVMVGSVLYECCTMLPGRFKAINRSRRRRRRFSLRNASLRGLYVATPFALVVGFAFISSVSASIFRVRACFPVGYIDPAGSPDGQRFFLRSDPSITCRPMSEEYASLVQLMWVLVAVWPVGVVVGFTLLLLPCRHAIIHGESNKLTRATRFLTAD